MSGNRLLTSPQAAGYLGVNQQTVRNWRDAGWFPVIQISKNTHRYRLSDLDEFIAKSRVVPPKIWDADSPELPTKVVERLLGIHHSLLYVMRSGGKLKDFSEHSIRKHIRRQVLRECMAAARAELKVLLNTKNTQIYAYRKQLNGQTCRRCSKPTLKPYFHVGDKPE